MNGISASMGIVTVTTGGPPGRGVPVGGTTGQVLAKLGSDDYDTGWVTTEGGGLPAPVQSVALSVPGGWSSSSANVGGSVTLTFGLPAGSSLVGGSDRTNWDAAYSERNRWDGSSTGLNASTGRSSLGLGNVDNTSDANKPISAATATALSGKANTGVIGSSGLTMAADRLLGRNTAGSGAPEEITIGANLTLSGGVLSASVSGGGGGTVSSVGLVAPTGFSVSGSPVTTSGNITLAFAAGYSLPTTASQGNWDTAFTERRYWDGSSTGLNAATGRASLELGTAATTDASAYATAAQGVTNGNSHNHDGGDGAQIAYSSLSGLPALPTGTNTGDQSLTNTSDATSHTVALSASGGSLQLVEGSNITLTTSGTSGAGVVTISASVTGGGGGDVVGPASSVDGRAALFDGTTGKLLKQSAAAPVLEGDSRLTDARTPTAHNQAASTITGLATVATTGAYADLSGRPTLGTAAALNVGTGAGTVAAGNDSRFTTDLSFDASTRLLSSSTGADVTLPLVTSTTAGLAPLSGGGTTNFLRADGTWAAPPSGGGGITDGDKGDITVSGSGTTWTIDNGVVDTANLGGDITAAGKALLDDADAAAQRSTLGLGTAAEAATTDFATAAQGTDSREWSAETIAQAEAEAGTATTRRAFTAQRVFQAVAAWWAASTDKTKLDGIAAGAQVNVATDLTYTASTRLLASSTGADATLPLVTSTDAGLAPASGGGTSNFLRADGTWAAPAGGGGGSAVYSGYKVGNWIVPSDGGSATGQANTADQMALAPFMVKRAVTLSELQVRVSNAVAGSLFELAVYGSEDNLPTGNPLATTTSQSGATVSNVQAAVTPFTLQSNVVYWAAVNSDSALTFFSTGVGSTYAASLVGGEGSPWSSGGVNFVCRVVNQPFGTWPNLTGVSTTMPPNNQRRVPVLAFLVSALP